jgi:hypothetical protein
MSVTFALLTVLFVGSIIYSPTFGNYPAYALGIILTTLIIAKLMEPC